MAKNKRQPYSVSEKAGHQTSAESWGTGKSKSLDEKISLIQYRSCGRTYSTCVRIRNPSCWSGSFRKHVSIWPHVRSNQDLAQMASKDQSRSKVSQYGGFKIQWADFLKAFCYGFGYCCVFGSISPSSSRTSYSDCP